MKHCNIFKLSSTPRIIKTYKSVCNIIKLQNTPRVKKDKSVCWSNVILYVFKYWHHSSSGGIVLRRRYRKQNLKKHSRNIFDKNKKQKDSSRDLKQLENEKGAGGLYNIFG